MKKLYRTVFSKPLQIYQDSYGLKMSTFLLSKKMCFQTAWFKYEKMEKKSKCSKLDHMTSMNNLVQKFYKSDHV